MSDADYTYTHKALAAAMVVTKEFLAASVLNQGSATAGRLDRPSPAWMKRYRAARAEYYHEVTGLRWPRK